MADVPRPALDLVHAPEAAPRAAVLFLHGGREASHEPVQRRHASWWRMALMARTVGRFDGTAATYLLRHGVRGWNDPGAPSPVADARDAVRQIGDEHPGVPVVLVGHSMGGRTACRVADEPPVAGVVALAPWLPAGEPVEAVRDRDVRIVHGTADRWTSAALSREWAHRAASVASSVEWHPIDGVGHYMFKRVTTWNRCVTDSVRQILRAD